MQENHSIEVRNRYTVLAADEDSAKEKYENFIKVNNEVASELISKVPKQRKTQFSKDIRVNETRKIIQDKCITYQNCLNNSNQDRYQEAKINLQNTYSEVIEEYYTEKVTKIENSRSSNKHELCMKLINEVSGCQSACQGQLEGYTQAYRVRNWYNHFKGLLVTLPSSIRKQRTLIQFHRFEHQNRAIYIRGVYQGKMFMRERLWRR